MGHHTPPRNLKFVDENYILFQGSSILEGITTKSFYWNRVHSNCLVASLKWFRNVHVHHAFLINDDKILFVLLNL